MIPPAAVCRGLAALEPFQRSLLTLLQTLPCLSSIMAGVRAGFGHLVCLQGSPWREGHTAGGVCVLLAGSRAHLSRCAERDQAATAPLCGQGSPHHKGDACEVSTSPSTDFPSSCQDSCYVLFLILSPKYAWKRLIFSDLCKWQMALFKPHEPLLRRSPLVPF